MQEVSDGLTFPVLEGIKGTSQTVRHYKCLMRKYKLQKDEF
jgi:hypothetical protein